MKHITLANDGTSATPRAQFANLAMSLECIESSLQRIDTSDNDDSDLRVRQVMDMYTQAINMLPRAAHFGLDIHSRLRELSGSEKLCRAASVRALLLEQKSLAVQVFEEGKAIFWTQILRSRDTALDALPDSDRIELSKLFRKLENSSSAGSPRSKDRIAAERLMDDRRQMNAEVERMVDEIRKRPGFERFLKIPAFEELIKAAARGPVVILLTTDIACFAVVIVDDTGKCESVQLTKISPSTLKQLNLDVRSSGLRDRGAIAPEDGDEAGTESADPIDLDHGSNTSSSERLGIRRTRRTDATSPYTILSSLWTSIVNPIIQALSLEVSMTRILFQTESSPYPLSPKTGRKCARTTTSTLVPYRRVHHPTAACGRGVHRAESGLRLGLYRVFVHTFALNPYQEPRRIHFNPLHRFESTANRRGKRARILASVQRTSGG
jgi:hypothetical protein